MKKLIGAVVIGRNEGERLERCLSSLKALMPRVVYVDSGSTDGSVDLARAMGAEVVELDMEHGFTAARARNRGLDRLKKVNAEIEFVQFVDGDCQLADGWLQVSAGALSADSKLAVVCGRRRERHPDRSIYNRLCDMEWNTPVGPAKSCGGDALMRVTALTQVGGYDDRVIAGEEPELCVRLRRAGWTVERLDHEMTRHDAAMIRVSQWWKRAQRAGHAYAEAMAMHGRSPDRHGVRATCSIWWWAFLWPILTLSATVAFGPVGLVALLAYPAMILKIASSRHRDVGDPWAHCLLLGLSCMIGKWPEWTGQLRYLRQRLFRQRATIIEYKEQPSSDG